MSFLGRQDISAWDVALVTNMSELFSNALAFNNPLNNWDVSKVTNFDHTFFKAGSFDQDLSSWDVSGGESMVAMFAYTPFNQDIGSWNVSSATDIKQMLLSGSSIAS